MLVRRFSFWLARRSAIIVALLFVGLGVAVAYMFTAGFASQQPQVVVGIAAISAFLAAISAVANLLQAVEVQRQRELLERPYVSAYFDAGSNAVVNFILHNAGNSPAVDLRVRFDPPPTDFAGRSLNEVSMFSKPISFLPAGGQIRQLVDVGYKFLADGRETKFKVTLDYQGPLGQTFHEEFKHDVEWMKENTLPEKSVEDRLDEIATALNELAKK